MKTVTLTNDFHRTETRVRLKPSKWGEGEITWQQEARARKALCGVDGCTCAGHAGVRGGLYVVEPDTWNWDDGTPQTFVVYAPQGGTA